MATNKFDIGLYVSNNSHNLTDSEKYNLLKTPWNPPDLYKFPASDRNLKFQQKWLIEFPWLVYSEVSAGAYCKYCSLFSCESSEVGKGSHMQLGRLVKDPLKKWKKAKEDFRSHMSADYHKKFSIMAQNFIKVYEHKADDVVSQIDLGRRAQILENRQKLVPIIKTVILCGRQEIALRGHRDKGILTAEESKHNEGNFRALLRYRIDGGDKILENHLRNCKLNASYISPKVQNEIIETCGEIIQESLINRINRAKCFTVLADETSDISGVEQFSLSARYVDEDNENTYILREDFLQFVPVSDMRGAALAETLLKTLLDIGVDIKFMRGQGYDGASAMSGPFQGCAAIVRQTCPQAVYIHCACHSFNLALCHACTVPVIKNCLGTMKEIINFFRISPKREHAFKNNVDELNPLPGSRRSRLLRFCETRWVEHLDAILLFKDLFIVITKTLSDIQESPDFDTDTSSKAYTLLSAVEKCSFIVAMTTVSKLFSLSHNLSSSFQAQTIDLVYLLKHLDILKKELEDMRGNANERFHSLFETAVTTCNESGVTVEMPRRAGRQIHRDNYETDNPEEYFRLAIFIPLLDYFLNQIEIRFLAHRQQLHSLQALLPKNCCSIQEDTIETLSSDLLQLWPDDVHNTMTLEAEFSLWKRKWIECSDEKDKPKYFISSLNQCDKNVFPAIHAFLKIGATLPVSVATSERSFSTLRRVKSYIRNSTGQERLNGLALMSIHRDIHIDPEAVLNKLASSKVRRLEFIL